VSGRFIIVFIPGAPKSKGSLEHRGNGKMRESVIGSTTWKRIMAGMLAAEWVRLGHGPPMVGPIRIDAVFFLPVKTADGLTARGAQGNYDLDKLTRNLLDAITDSGIWNDDSQATDLYVFKRKVGDLGHQSQGVHVTIQEIGPGPS
jgi:Holliday junction resolvase RusA-like endonuclease